MTQFDDDDLEDAWSPDDPLSVQTTNLLRRLAVLIASDGLDLESDLDLIAFVLPRVRRIRPLEGDVIWAANLETDLALARARL